ncbi:hypothetical protein SADUNF_Sadunf03G0151700 [Salix dunnii]|uniref:Uncharacterized protein n=1 Tax=Salix dunnii TaxID=1413687 RepID=A0A835TEF7_9ROSI|nr:hypothetical protein SADUNF_Sadunf03G0151700 [Salix dunnii]
MDSNTQTIISCERLILLESDFKELRDFSALLYHWGLYEQSLQYLELLDEDAVEILIRRLGLISMEEDSACPQEAWNMWVSVLATLAELRNSDTGIPMSSV